MPIQEITKYERIEKFIHTYKTHLGKTQEGVDAIERVFTRGGCYVFAKILWVRFGGEIYNDTGHIVYHNDGRFYDITGDVTNLVSQTSYILHTEPREYNLYETFTNFNNLDYGM